MKNFLHDNDRGDFLIVTDGLAKLDMIDAYESGIWREMPQVSIEIGNSFLNQKSRAKIVERLKSTKPKAVKTFAPNFDEAFMVFQGAVHETNNNVEIIYISSSPHIAKLTVDNCTEAINCLGKTYKNRKFTIINSHCVSSGLTMLLKEAAKYTGERKDFEDFIEKKSKRIAHYFTGDTKYLKNSVYVDFESKTSLIDNILKKQPLFFILFDRIPISVSALETRPRIITFWASVILGNVDQTAPIRIEYGNEASREDAKLLKMLLERKRITNVEISPTNPALICHAGPNYLGVFFSIKDAT